MSKVADIPSVEVPFLPRSALVRRAADLVAAPGEGGVVVANEDGSPAGVVTEADLVRRVIAADRPPWATTVESVMSAPVVSVDEACPLDVAGRLMADRGIRHLRVTRAGRLAGWITARSLIGSSVLAPVPIREAMTKPLATIFLNETARVAADRMLDASIGALLVGGRRTRPRSGGWRGAAHNDLAGIVTEADLVRRVIGADRYPYVTAMGDVMATRLVTIDAAGLIAAAAEIMVRQGVRHLLVSEGAEIVGIVSVRDVLGSVRSPEMAATGGEGAA